MSYFAAERFMQVIYMKGATAAGTGDASGSSYLNAKGIIDGDIWVIPVGCVIQSCFAIIDVAITGSTDLDIGDDDDSDGYIDGSLSLTLATPGMYGHNAKVAGAYLRVQTAGATDAGDIYVVPTSKYYPAAGKELKADNSTTNTAGSLRVVVVGMLLGT